MQTAERSLKEKASESLERCLQEVTEGKFIEIVHYDTDGTRKAVTAQKYTGRLKEYVYDMRNFLNDTLENLQDGDRVVVSVVEW